MNHRVYFNCMFIFFIFQTVVAQLTDSGIPFPVPVQTIADMLSPLAEHACSFVGIQ